MCTHDACFRLSLVVWGMWWLDMLLASLVSVTTLRTHGTLWWGVRWAWRIGVWSWATFHIPTVRERLFLSPPESPHGIVVALLLTLAYVGITLIAWFLSQPRPRLAILPVPASSYAFVLFALADAFTQQAVYALIRASAPSSHIAWWLMFGVGVSLWPLGWVAHHRGRAWPRETDIWAWLGIVGGTGLVLSTQFLGTAVVWEWVVRMATHGSGDVRKLAPPEK